MSKIRQPPRCSFVYDMQVVRDPWERSHRVKEIRLCSKRLHNNRYFWYDRKQDHRLLAPFTVYLASVRSQKATERATSCETFFAVPESNRGMVTFILLYSFNGNPSQHQLSFTAGTLIILKEGQEGSA